MRRRLVLAACFLLLGASAPAVVGTPEAVWLTATDGAVVRGDLYALDGEKSKSAPVVLLFHQAGSNRGEYATIGPRLNEMGFHALAIDQRSGGERWGAANETVNKLGESTKYLAALPDLEAALKWKAASPYAGKTVVWGSSYSASLVFLLAAKHPGIDAVLSFSPGEYLGTRTDEVRQAAVKVGQPVFIITPSDEEERATKIFDVVPDGNKKLIIPERAVHGSSMLVPDRNPGAAEIWPKVALFLESVR